MCNYDYIRSVIMIFMTDKILYDKVINYFQTNMPVAETELKYRTPFELLVAVILSAQCTDKRVNMITPAFFENYPDPSLLSEAEVQDVFLLIKSCTYPNNKAKNLVAMAKMLVKEFEGVVPDSIESLQLLPGVGRKTANVIASVVYKKPALAVDTHVHRVAARIGLSKNSKSPLDTERQLIRNIPEDLIPIAHHWLILHGRYTCIARSPKCNQCGLSFVCKYYNGQKD